MWAILSFMGHYWQWIVIGAIAVFACGVVAFYLKNWKPLACAVCLFVLFLASQALYAAGYNARVAFEVAQRTKLLEDRIATYEALAAEDKKRSDDDAAAIAKLLFQISATPENKKIALPKDAVRRIGAVK